MTIVKLYRRALLPVLGLALLILPAQSPAAPGLGRVDIAPDHVAAGSTNTFTLTFNADTGPLQGQTLIDIPRGWSLPQATRVGATGYVALARDTCSSATRLGRVAGYLIRRQQSENCGPADGRTAIGDHGGINSGLARLQARRR